MVVLEDADEKLRAREEGSWWAFILCPKLTYS